MDFYYNEIKEQIINNEITKKVKDYSKNKSDLTTYYNVGKLLSDAGKHYGGIIKNYSIKLTNELGKGYTISNLKRFRQFYTYIQNGVTVSHHLTWSHYIDLLPLENIDKINYYIKVVIEQNLSVRELRAKIKSNEYERLPEDTKNKLINKEELNIKDTIPNPIIINNKNNYDENKEFFLKTMILENIDDFLKQLGNGFTYVGNEYKIKVGSKFNYIDLLLFNFEYNCFVVIELKVTELKKDHIGQIQFYMNYVNDNIKKITMDNTIGIILVRKNDEFVMEYCSDERILSKEYLINS